MKLAIGLIVAAAVAGCTFKSTTVKEVAAPPRVVYTTPAPVVYATPAPTAPTIVYAAPAPTIVYRTVTPTYVYAEPRTVTYTVVRRSQFGRNY